MNAAQRRQQRRALGRAWPAGTLVRWGAIKYAIVNASRVVPGTLMIRNERGTFFAAPYRLTRVQP